MCGPLNTTVVNGYMNQDSHAVSWGHIGFFLYLKLVDVDASTTFNLLNPTGAVD